jgi:hypothetical protein
MKNLLIVFSLILGATNIHAASQLHEYWNITPQVTQKVFNGDLVVNGNSNSYIISPSSGIIYYNGFAISPNVTTSAIWDIGQVYVSSTSFPAFTGRYTDIRSTITLQYCYAYSERTSTDTLRQVQWDIVYSSQTSGASTARTWASIFTSTVPWLGANNIKSNNFTPDTININPGWMIAPRIISVPNGTLPYIRIEAVYQRSYNY